MSFDHLHHVQQTFTNLPFFFLLDASLPECSEQGRWDCLRRGDKSFLTYQSDVQVKDVDTPPDDHTTPCATYMYNEQKFRNLYETLTPLPNVLILNPCLRLNSMTIEHTFTSAIKAQEVEYLSCSRSTLTGFQPCGKRAERLGRRLADP